MIMKECGIYGIRCIVNGKWYIGQSGDIKHRQRKHLEALRSNRHYNIHLQRAFNNYGEQSFEFHILEIVHEDMLDIRERAWITYHKSNDYIYGYNSEDGGNARKRFSKEARRRMSESHKGKPTAWTGRHHSKETRLKMSLAKKGTIQSELTKAKRSQSLKGRIFSDESKAKMSKALRLRYSNPEARIKLSNILKGKPSRRIGYIHSEETKRKISESHKKRHQHLGE